MVQLMAAMVRPQTYPHPVTVPIRVIQTHISLVFLTGERVYKVKKPVNFGFLDFSTLDKRRHYCAEEVRLNQRGAPGLYIGVAEIRREGDRFTVGGTQGEVVDYAVQMHQFAQDQLFSQRFEQGLLTADHVVALGHRVAAFHQQTHTSPTICRFGDRAQIKSSIDENYWQTEQFVGSLQTAQQLEDTRAFSDRFLIEQAEAFRQRQREHRIRECHGDLHLRNICYWHGDIQLFDCIEFNDAFRWVDVMYDVAFTVMDLEARGRTDLATLFLNVYVEDTGDWEGLRVLPLYRSRQAYVRAKVASFLTLDPQCSEGDRHEAAQSAQRYYRLAWQYTQTRQGQIWIMHGLSGSGKSTVARQRATQVGGIHVRSDAVRKHLAGVPLYERGPASLYTPEMTARTYQRLIDLGITLARQGYSVFLDARFDQRHWRQLAIAQATQAHLPMTILHCTAPVEVLRDRLRHRQGDITDATAALLEQQLAQTQPLTASEQAYADTIHTDEPIHPATSVEQP